MGFTIKLSGDAFPDTGWLDAARQAQDAPAELRPLLDGSAESIAVEPEDVQAITAWAAGLPGWKAHFDPVSGSAHRPLVFEMTA